MSRTTIEYVLKILRENKFKYFRIIDDQSGEPAYEQRNDKFTSQKAEDTILDFLKYNTGTYTIELRNMNPNQGARGQRHSYNISNMDNDIPSRIQGLTGIPMVGQRTEGDMSQRDMFDMYQSALAENQKLLNEKMSLTVQHMKDMHEMRGQIMELQTKLNQEKEGDKMSQMAIGALSSIFGGGSTPMPSINGIGDSQEGVDLGISADEEVRLERALTILSQNDPNLVSNLENLAKLVQKNPAMYKQGIQMIQSMV
jgi:hypothetical protein